MAVLTVVTPIITGIDPGLVSAAMAGDSFDNTGKEVLLVINAATDVIITFDSPNTCSFDLGADAAHDEIDTTSANSERLVGPFPTDRFNDANGRVQMTYDTEVNVTVAVFKMI